jgi:manganese/zinc/iron transport system permease protein
MSALLADYTLRVVALGAALLGALVGGLGTFALLRRQSLLGDAISHAALPGIALAFLLTGSKGTLVLLVGAGIAGGLAVAILSGITASTRIKEDTALGLVLSVLFGLGMMLLTMVQKRPDASQAGLDRFLFGQAAALMRGDLVVLAWLAALALAVVLALWKELKILCFDPDLAAALGYRVRRLESVLLALLVVAIVVGLQTVGVVLISALVVAPASAARQWTDRLALMAALAAGFGAVAGASGAVISSVTPRLPTGPTVVVVLAAIAAVSLLLAPARGLLWAAAARKRSGRRLRLEAVLVDLHLLAEQHDDPGHGHSPAVLAALHRGRAGIDRTLARLADAGLVRRRDGPLWALTEAGRRRARELASGRAEEAP